MMQTQESTQPEQSYPAKRLASAIGAQTMYLLRVPSNGPPSCHPVDPAEVRFYETQGGWRIKRARREPQAWAWTSVHGSGVSVLAYSPAEAWERYAHFQEGRHGHA